jgi:hypothetical protein
LAALFSAWNIWTRWADRPTPFFVALSRLLDGKSKEDEGHAMFFAHKIVIMHPYTDESILSDILGKIILWGERSAAAVENADLMVGVARKKGREDPTRDSASRKET